MHGAWCITGFIRTRFRSHRQKERTQAFVRYFCLFDRKLLRINLVIHAAPCVNYYVNYLSSIIQTPAQPISQDMTMKMKKVTEQTARFANF